MRMKVTDTYEKCREAKVWACDLIWFRRHRNSHPRFNGGNIAID